MATDFIPKFAGLFVVLILVLVVAVPVVSTMSTTTETETETVYLGQQNYDNLVASDYFANCKFGTIVEGAFVEYEGELTDEQKNDPDTILMLRSDRMHSIIETYGFVTAGSFYSPSPNLLYTYDLSNPGECETASEDVMGSFIITQDSDGYAPSVYVYTNKADYTSTNTYYGLGGVTTKTTTVTVELIPMGDLLVAILILFAVILAVGLLARTNGGA